MRRLFSLKTLILVLLAAGIGALVALVVNQKQKFAGMSEGEIRAYLDAKLGGRMSDDQIAQIQDAVVTAVKGAVDVAEEAGEFVAEVAEIEVVEGVESVEGSVKEAEDAAAVVDEVKEEKKEEDA